MAKLTGVGGAVVTGLGLCPCGDGDAMPTESQSSAFVFNSPCAALMMSAACKPSVSLPTRTEMKNGSILEKTYLLRDPVNNSLQMRRRHQRHHARIRHPQITRAVDQQLGVHDAAQR